MQWHSGNMKLPENWKHDYLTINPCESSYSDAELLRILESSGLPRTVEELAEEINRHLEAFSPGVTEWKLVEVSRETDDYSMNPVLRCSIVRTMNDSERAYEQEAIKRKEVQAKINKRNALKRTLKGLEEAGQGSSESANVLKEQIKELGGRV